MSRQISREELKTIIWGGKMTLREKVKQINPECVNDAYGGGVIDCPSEYKYLHDNKNALNCGWVGRWWNKEVDCKKCWNREFKEVE